MTMKQTEHLLDSMKAAKKLSVAVGVNSDTGYVYPGGKTVQEIARVHEYGMTIKHPGGTSYIIMSNGKAKFVKKGTKGIVGVTKPHDIVIPRRSFLRIPFELKKKEINEFIRKQFVKVSEGMDAKKALGLVGVYCENISVKSWETNGYGLWKANASATKRAKGSSGILFDTGVLKQSITSAVR